MAALHIPNPQPAPPPVPDLSQADVRARLSPTAVDALVRLAVLWRLPNPTASQLFGVTERTWGRMKAGTWGGVLDQDEITRASLVIGIAKGLRLLFSERLADDWPGLPNAQQPFEGRTPVEVMLEGGIPAMIEVRRHVDALRGGL